MLVPRNLKNTSPKRAGERAPLSKGGEGRQHYPTEERRKATERRGSSTTQEKRGSSTTQQKRGGEAAPPNRREEGKQHHQTEEKMGSSTTQQKRGGEAAPPNRREEGKQHHPTEERRGSSINRKDLLTTQQPDETVLRRTDSQKKTPPEKQAKRQS